MSKVLVVVYSYTGTALAVAQLLCSQQPDWRLAHVTEERPRSGTLGYWRCVMDSLLARRPAIRYNGPPPSDFDAVVLVSPIWAFQLASPMRTFVHLRREELANVSVISTMGGKGAPNAFAEVAEILDQKLVLSTAFTQREVDDGSYAARLQAFGAAVAAAEDSTEAVRPVVLSPQTV
ncbi:MAG: flavodoxin [Gammaproteobacteria bacterium]|nr:flavodoxin [Gammaproteobacteria bacterium]MBU1442168.1 flavodoxin [Gammaproteobacteria bacterium]MBU2407854.1 flavodoxin [Gammaproteobacteria bacterium]